MSIPSWQTKIYKEQSTKLLKIMGVPFESSLTPTQLESLILSHIPDQTPTEVSIDDAEPGTASSATTPLPRESDTPWIGREAAFQSTQVSSTISDADAAGTSAPIEVPSSETPIELQVASESAEGTPQCCMPKLAENCGAGDLPTDDDELTSIQTRSQIAEVEKNHATKRYIEEIKQKQWTVEKMKAIIARMVPTKTSSLNKEETLELLVKLVQKQRLDGAFALETLGMVTAAGKPETIAFHGKTFNVVDRIDLMLSFVRSSDKTKSIGIAILRYIIQLAVVQLHSLLSESSWQEVSGDDIRAASRRPRGVKLAPAFKLVKRGIKECLECLISEFRSEEERSENTNTLPQKRSSSTFSASKRQRMEPLEG